MSIKQSRRINKLKILHVGNIANNAYLNSKFLREKGIQSDVLCYDYYHIMGMPEWEDAEIKGDYGNDFSPDFSKVSLGKFKIPPWFIKGTLEKIAYNKYRWIQINKINKSLRSLLISIAWQMLEIRKIFYNFYNRNEKLFKKYRFIFYLSQPLGISINLLIRYLFWSQKQLLPEEQRKENIEEKFSFWQKLINDFAVFFPERKDKLKLSDIIFFLYRAEIFEKIFKKYDLIQSYATDPMYCLLADKHPYIAFEHGTLREIPFENSSVGRLTALAYRKADLVLVTNSDSQNAIKKLGLKNYQIIPHPLDNYWHLKYKDIRKEDNNILLFCPVRHDWKIKGIDLYIKTLPEVIKKIDKEIKLIFLEWGMDVEESKRLIKDCNLEKHVEWLKPLPRYKFAYWLAKADIILDQLVLPAMGGITPEAMQAGKPVLISYRHNVSKWMYTEKPPVIEVHTKEDIIKNLIRLIKDQKYRTKIGKQGQTWFKKNHSKEVVTKILIKNYNKLLIQNKKRKNNL